MTEPRASSHRRAAEDFAHRARERFGDAISSVMLYGSVARGEARGVGSDVDLLVVLSDDIDEAAFEARVRDPAYDIELDRGVVLSLIVLTAAEYEDRSTRPFFQHVRRDVDVLYG